MEQLVIGRILADNKVVGPVVRFDSIDVMDFGTNWKRLPERLFCNQDVLIYISGQCVGARVLRLANQPVPAAIVCRSSAPSVPRMMVFAARKVPGSTPRRSSHVVSHSIAHRVAPDISTGSVRHRRDGCRCAATASTKDWRAKIGRSGANSFRVVALHESTQNRVAATAFTELDRFHRSPPTGAIGERGRKSCRRSALRRGATPNPPLKYTLKGSPK